MNGFIRLVADVWQSGWFGKLVVVLVVALVLWVLAKLYGKVSWFWRRRHCQHYGDARFPECAKWTLEYSQGQIDGCQEGQPCCAACQVRHQAYAERAVPCPNGHGPMAKVIDDRLIFDRCQACHSVFLDGGELELLRQRSEQHGYDDGHSSGMLMGGLIGALIGETLAD